MLEVAKRSGLSPTPWAVEALSYYDRAKILQDQNLREFGGEIFKRKSCGDALQDAIPIYDTVRRRYAGFSNVLEQLRYGGSAPKYPVNLAKGRPTYGFTSPNRDYGFTSPNREMWLYICLVHRMTGSGASFEHDHGWRNTIVPQMATFRRLEEMAEFVRTHPGPSGTSIGNQFPAVSTTRELRGARNHLQLYLADDCPRFVKDMVSWFYTRGRAVTIKEAVTYALERHEAMGQKRFVFQLTAWAMDLAEYCPEWVNPRSDCLHGKNAQEALHLCFEKQPGAKMRRQEFYDRGTRVFCDVTGTWPMDVEDAAPGCDLIRWVENYVPKKGFSHIYEMNIYNSSTLIYKKGRQPSR
jgi:hypothetical protein